MSELLQNPIGFCVLISLGGYGAGLYLQKKIKHPLCNPLLIAVILVILILVIFRIPYSSYDGGSKYITSFLTPATICLAIPLYERMSLLKRNWKAILIGVISGVLTSLCSVFFLALLFRFSHTEYVTLLPKSITTAIGIGISEELGGYVTLSVAAILITGILGNIFAETVCRLFKITEPIAIGVAIGASSHAIGTSKAMELGEIQGAMSSLAIVVSGILTVVGSSVFSIFI